MNTSIKTFTLTFLIAGSIDGIRNIAPMAHFGDSLIFFFIISSIIFLIPVALIAAILSACWPDQGGIYSWVRLAFGEKAAFMAVWLQWTNTMIWMPIILAFLACTSAYLFNPDLAINKYYLVSTMFFMNLLLTYVNLKGIHVIANLSSICSIIGTMFPILVIIILGCSWYLSGYPLQVSLNINSIIPNFSSINDLISLTAIITSFLGVELATVHIRNVVNPQQTFPKALALSTILIIVTMLFGALTIAMVLPKEQIGFVNGIAEMFSCFLKKFNLNFLLPIVIILMLVGCFGQIISWIISPARGLLQAVEFGFLPKFFAKTNKYGAPQNIIMIQSILVFLLTLSFLVVPSINSIYWFLNALSTELYVLMYVTMFIAAIALMSKVKETQGCFKIPGGTKGYLFTCILGMIGCLCALIVGFVPPENNNLGTTIPYQIIFGVAMLLMISPIFIFYFYQIMKSKKMIKSTKSLISEKTTGNRMAL